MAVNRGVDDLCGIVGFLNPEIQTKGYRLIKEMANRVAHRGPDSEGFFIAPGVAFGHRRLSILDIEHGSQPMTTSNGRFTIIYNGEIYNYLKLRRELQDKGWSFVTNSDTEVVLKSFQAWGVDCFLKFQGMFAIAIWDREERACHLARDHFGIKPLYYVHMDGGFIFASEIKALFIHENVRREVNPAALGSLLMFNNILGQDSFWADVKRVAPGERLTYRGGELSSDQFFSLSNVENTQRDISFDDAVENYHQCLAYSVNDHLISDVPVGAYLSGGIDSGSVATLASTTMSKPLPVFTGHFKSDNTWYDEREGAAAVAETRGMDSYHQSISEEDYEEHIARVAYHLDEPTLGSSSISQYLVAKTASEKVKVVLTGHGGDELFAGYPVFKAAMLRTTKIGLDSLRCLAVKSADEMARLIYFSLLGIFDETIARGQLRMYSAKAFFSVAGPKLRQYFLGLENIHTDFLKTVQPINTGIDVDGVTKWYLATYLPTLLVQEDKIGMAHGLESRTPICYEPLIRLSLSLPDSVKMHRGKLKAIPYAAMRTSLPSLTYKQPKRGFPTPLVEWLSGRLGREWEKTWRDIPDQLEGFLDSADVRRQFAFFRRFSYRAPNAYAIAHRLFSLQMVKECVTALVGLPYVSASSVKTGEDERFINPLVLAR